MTQYWLFKTEPTSYGFDQLQRDRITPWSGVRSYQARNIMMRMHVGDLGFFYHSSTAVPAIVGICRVVKTAHADTTAFDRSSEYYDPRSTPEKPIWMMVDVEYVEPLEHPVTLAYLRTQPRLATMLLLRKGSRLSVQPVSAQEWEFIRALARTPE